MNGLYDINIEEESRGDDYENNVRFFFVLVLILTLP